MFPSVVLFWSYCQHRRSAPACPCFLKWRNASWGHTERSSVEASERSARGITSMGGGGVGGVNGFGSALIWEFLSEFTDELGFCSEFTNTWELCWGGTVGPLGYRGGQGRGGGENLSRASVHDYCCSRGGLWSRYCVCRRGSALK